MQTNSWLLSNALFFSVYLPFCLSPLKWNCYKKLEDCSFLWKWANCQIQQGIKSFPVRYERLLFQENKDNCYCDMTVIQKTILKLAVTVTLSLFVVLKVIVCVLITSRGWLLSNCTEVFGNCWLLCWLLRTCILVTLGKSPGLMWCSLCRTV